MEYSQQLLKLSSLALILSLSACHNTPLPNIPETSQRYVNLSAPLQTTPFAQIYILNSDSSKQIAYWTKVVNSLPGVNPPYPYFNLPLIPNQSTMFNLVVPVPISTSSTGFIGCSLTFDQNGIAQQTASNACAGLVNLPNQNYQHQPLSSQVTVYNLGANFGQPVQVNANILNKQVAPQVIPRTLTFLNKSNNDVCLVNQIKGNPDSAPTPAQMCNGQYQTLVPSGQSVDFTIPVSGLNSAAWIIAGYRTPGAKIWTQTGFAGANRNQAATKIELTMFPYYPLGITAGPIVNSVGPTNIDISSVDGVNLTYRFYPQPAIAGTTQICTLANNNITPATQYTGIYSSTAPISYFNNTNNNGKFSCPPGNAYSNVGCTSPCTLAYMNHASQEIINQTCCINDYGTNSSCTSTSNPNNPANAAYTAMIHNQFINSYAFAYDDAKADFTCDAFASYIFEIDDVGNGILN